MAIHRARFFARSAGTERVAANANAIRDRSHRFPIHNVKQRTLLRSRGAFLCAGSLLPLHLCSFRPE
jgi:hypothetical protein